MLERFEGMNVGGMCMMKGQVMLFIARAKNSNQLSIGRQPHLAQPTPVSLYIDTFCRELVDRYIEWTLYNCTVVVAVYRIYIKTCTRAVCGYK